MFHLEDADYKILGKFGNYLPIYTALYHRRVECF
jgi:hypothetical protein